MSVLLERHNPANQLMGEILISQQWVTPSQLSEAIGEQRRTNERLGEIMVRRGYLTRMDLDFILAQQQGNTLTGDADEVSQRLGDFLRKARRLSPAALDRAVAEQKRTNEKLGEVLVRLGLIDPLELAAVRQRLRHEGDDRRLRDGLRVADRQGVVLVGAVLQRIVDESLAASAKHAPCDPAHVARLQGAVASTWKSLEDNPQRHAFIERVTALDKVVA